MNPRYEGRNGEIWQAYLNGKTQEAIAAQHGITRERVSQILAQVRESIPETTKEQLFQRELDFLDKLRSLAMEIQEQPAAPVTAGKDGLVVRDPETGEVVRDYTGKLAAMDRAARMHERLAKMLGLDAPTKADLTVTEAAQDAARAAAGDAAAYLGSGDGE